jgi:citrate synthase
LGGEGWNTAVTSIAPNQIRVRGYRIDELMGTVPFGSAVYLILRGELPTEAVGRLVEAMLVASIDHGVTPPSTLSVRNAASTGAPLNACLAAGALAVNRHHGGAVEDCMRLLARGAGATVVETFDALPAAVAAVLGERHG